MVDIDDDDARRVLQLVIFDAFSSFLSFTLSDCLLDEGLGTQLNLLRVAHTIRHGHDIFLHEEHRVGACIAL